MYQYYNPHPQGGSSNDCVKRAIVVVTGMDYMEVKRELNAYKKITGAKQFNSDRNPHRYVEDVLGAVRIGAEGNMTVKDFCAVHPCGRFILDTPGHWVGVFNSDYYDEWDSGGERVNFAYEIISEPYTPPDLKKQVFKYCCTSERISDTQTLVRIYDGNGSFVERKIPTELTGGYVLCLQHGHYKYIDLDRGDGK